MIVVCAVFVCLRAFCIHVCFVCELVCVMLYGVCLCADVFV